MNVKENKSNSGVFRQTADRVRKATALLPLAAIVRWVAATALIVVCFAGFSSCHRKPTVSVDHRDSVRIEYRERYRDRLIRDTTYVRDSIMVRERNDTIVMYHERYHYIDRFVGDTVRLVDTVCQTVYKDRVVVDVQRYIPLRYRISMVVSIVAVLGLILIVYSRIRRGF